MIAQVLVRSAVFAHGGGSKFGYFTNTNKTWLLTKIDHYSKAVTAFAGTGVKITTEGRPYTSEYPSARMHEYTSKPS